MDKDYKPIVAICYDFDKTLSPKNMQEQGFMQLIEYDEKEFWLKSNTCARANNMDYNLSYMFQMLKQSHGEQVFSKKFLNICGSKIKFYDGVIEWFDRINKFGDSKGVTIEHYIISCGLKEMIEGTPIAKYFKKIYACSYLYDEAGVAAWPAQVVNFTNKTQFLYRIEKDALDENDPKVNEKIEKIDVRVPFENMIYIGDSETDIPCMKLVKSNGGTSICLYGSNKANAFKMMRDERVDYYAEANYSENSELDKIVKLVIEKVAISSELYEHSKCCKENQIENDSKNDFNATRKNELLLKLYNSYNFARTHEIIKQLSKYSNWTEEESLFLMDVALKNTQVLYILGDYDVNKFYVKIINILKTHGVSTEELEKELNNKP